jgi:RNA polymerase sigma-70 factor (ECF subfamily)
LGFIRNISSPLTSDAELLQKFSDGNDASALALLYGRYMDLVYGVCLKYLRDPESSKDAVMEIYEELYRKVALHEITNFRSWLYSVHTTAVLQ